MGFKNRIEVDLVNKEAETSQPENDKQQVHRGETALLKYDHEQLINISKHVKGDRRLNILDSNVVNIIRNLRIYHQGCRGKRKNIPRLTSITHNTLIEVKAIVNHNTKPSWKSCQMVVINAQSIKSKEHIIMEYLMDKQVDLAILMETWLCEEDDTLVKALECNKNGYKLDTVNRNDRREEGIGFIYWETIKVVKCKSRKTETYEHTVWSIKANNTTTTVPVVYHPPYLDKAPITNAMFLDEITGFLATFLVKHNNIIITDDFNIHVKDTNDPEAQISLDTMEALRLDNHINFATHNRGNTLDLVLTEVLSSLSVVTCRWGPFLSDHCCIEPEVAIPTPALKRQTIISCNIKDIVIEDLVKQLDLGTIDGENINDLVNQLDNKCKTALDTLAPETTKCVTIWKWNADSPRKFWTKRRW